MFWFTADEHYGHKNIIEYCNRPFENSYAMNDWIINRHNEVVKKGDTVIHAGDFTLKGYNYAMSVLKYLNGNHFFIKGSHDYWDKKLPYMWEGKVQDEYIVVCHYAMRVWHRSHYNSWQLYGHSHGTLKPIGKQYDIGVDNNNFYPVSFEQLKEIMKNRPNNPNFGRSRRV